MSKTSAILQTLAFEDVIKTDAGLRVLKRIIEECGVYRTSYSPDNGAMAYMEGRRSIGLMILGMFEKYKPEYNRMLNIGDD